MLSSKPIFSTQIFSPRMRGNSKVAEQKLGSSSILTGNSHLVIEKIIEIYPVPSTYRNRQSSF